MLREAVTDGSEVGREAKSYMDRGLLVPDEIIMQLIKMRLSRDDAMGGLLFDGFPRTIPQAMALETLTDVSMVISLVVEMMRLSLGLPVGEPIQKLGRYIT